MKRKHSESGQAVIPTSETQVKRSSAFSRKVLVGAAISAVFAIGTMGLGAGAANAATDVGYGNGFSDAWQAPNGVLTLCQEAGVSPPRGTTTLVGPETNVDGVTDPTQLATLNYLATQIQSGDSATIAAANSISHNITQPAAWYNELSSAGYPGASGDSLAEAEWTSGGRNAAVTAAYNTLEAGIAGIQVGSNGGGTVSAGTVTATLNVESKNNYNGTLTLTPTVPGGVATFDLVNGEVKSTGSSSWSGTLNGPTTIDIIGIPPAGDPSYKISVASGNYTVTGSTGTPGYLPEVIEYTTPGEQTTFGPAGQATLSNASASTQFSVDEPKDSSAFFSPSTVTQLGSQYYVAGQAITDAATIGLGQNPDGTTNQWLQNQATGVYVPVSGTAKLYYSATPITESATVPSSAKLIDTTSFTAGGTTTNPVGSSVPLKFSALSSDEVAAAGYYTVVTSFAKTDQSGIVQLFWGSDFTSDFGIATESATVPPKVTTQAQTTTGQSVIVGTTSVPATGVGLNVSDNVTVTGPVDASSGFYVVDRHYTQPNTVSSTGSPITPASPVCDASTLDYTSGHIAITADGTLTNAASFDATAAGVGGWVETLYSPNGTALNSDTCADTSEWTYVAQLLVTTTAASNGTGSAVDHTTVWGTPESGSQISWALYDQSGKAASDSDAMVGIAGPVGLPGGVLNGYQLTSPAVSFAASDTATKYFVESVSDVNGNVYEQGLRGVSAESLTPAGVVSSTSAVQSEGLPEISG